MKTSTRRVKTPKYLELAEQLREQVQGGRLKPGDQLPSLVEMRTMHNVSRGTVEKVHTLLEQDGLIVREQGRGVFVARMERKRQRNGVIGFIAGGFDEIQSSLYWAHLVAGIRAAAAEEKIQLLLLNRDAGPEVWDKVDGLLVSENEEDLARLVEQLPASMPCVSLMTPWPDMTCVLADDYQGARDATRHLLELGHQRIGHLVAGHNHLIESRVNGYSDALREAGIEPKLSWVRQLRMRPNQADSRREYMDQGRRTIREWLARDWETVGCTALLAQNDHAAIGAIGALQEAGLRVPEDVSVVGFDGTENYEFFRPRLTTVVTPLHEIGETAVRLLTNQINGLNGHPENFVHQTPLHLGESTGACAAVAV